MRALLGRSQDPDCWPTSGCAASALVPAGNAPDLAAGHPDACLRAAAVSASRVHSSFALRIGHFEFAGGFIGGFTGRRELDEIENGAALRGEPGRATSTGLHPQPVKATLIEGLQPFPYRLGVASQRFGDLAGTQPIPAVGHDLRVKDPVGRRSSRGPVCGRCVLRWRPGADAAVSCLGMGHLLAPLSLHILYHHSGTSYYYYRS